MTTLSLCPLNIQPIVVVSGLKRQQTAALTNFVGGFLLALSSFSLLLLSALSDLTGRSAGPLARTTYSISIPLSFWLRSIINVSNRSTMDGT